MCQNPGNSTGEVLMMLLMIPPVDCGGLYCDSPLQRVAWSYFGVKGRSKLR